MTTPRDASENVIDLVRIARDHPVWALGLIPILVSCVRIAIVSHGNTETMRSLVQDLDVLALGLATALPLASSFAFWLFLAWMGNRMNKRKTSEQRIAASGNVILVGVIVVIVICAAMPLGYVVANGAVLLFCILASLRIHYKKKNGKRTTGWQLSVALVLVGLLMTGVAMLVLGGMWLPKERIMIRGGASPVVGYVLSSDVRWTRYLDTDGIVNIVPSSDVVARETVRNDGWQQKTISGLWN